MTLKDKQKMYARFQSKMESACYQCVTERVKQYDVTVSDTFIIDDVVPEVWKHLEETIDSIIYNHVYKK
jgi:hypothetical protein